MVDFPQLWPPRLESSNHTKSRSPPQRVWLTAYGSNGLWDAAGERCHPILQMKTAESTSWSQLIIGNGFHVAQESLIQTVNLQFVSLLLCLFRRSIPGLNILQPQRGKARGERCLGLQTHSQPSNYRQWSFQIIRAEYMSSMSGM
jgi:hypothetical protein